VHGVSFSKQRHNVAGAETPADCLSIIATVTDGALSGTHGAWAGFRRGNRKVLAHCVEQVANGVVTNIRHHDVRRFVTVEIQIGHAIGRLVKTGSDGEGCGSLESSIAITSPYRDGWQRHVEFPITVKVGLQPPAALDPRLGLGARVPVRSSGFGDIDKTTDTQGVDFGPYLQQVVNNIKEHWYAVIPPSAMPPVLKKGKLSIEFAILKNGQIAGIRYRSSSADVALDRAASDRPK